MRTLLAVVLVFMTGIDWGHLLFNEEKPMEIINIKLQPVANGNKLTAAFDNGLEVIAFITKDKVITSRYDAQGKIQKALVEYTNNLPNHQWRSKATLESISIEGVTIADSRSTIIYAAHVSFIDSGEFKDLQLDEFINGYEVF